MRKQEKFTKQGVRDLGGNSRRKDDDQEIVLRPYKVTIGEDGMRGMNLIVEASSAKEAFFHGKRRLRETNTPTWIVLSVTSEDGRKIFYDHMGGWL